MSRLLVAFTIYLMSYAPLLKWTADPEFPIFRSSAFFRPAEWITLHTPLRPVLLKWSEIVGAGPEFELQMFFLLRESRTTLNCRIGISS